MIYSYILLFIFVYIIWLCYLEFSPSLGGIVLRPNSEGEMIISYNSIMNISFYPLRNMNCWYPRFWDLNIFIIIFISFCIFYFIFR
jgi:hypothetical protein